MKLFKLCEFGGYWNEFNFLFMRPSYSNVIIMHKHICKLVLHLKHRLKKTHTHTHTHTHTVIFFIKVHHLLHQLNAQS